MTTCTGNAHIGHQCPNAASLPTILPFGHNDTAPGPQIGTILQLGSSYAGRNNRNKICYENAFFSYVRVPIHRYECTPRYSAVPAQSSPAQLRMPPGTHSLSSLNRNNNPKLFQSWNRNNLRLLKGATTPESLPITYEFEDIARPSAGRNRNTSPKLFQSCDSEQENPAKTATSPEPSHLRYGPPALSGPFPDKNRNTKPKLFQSCDRNNLCSLCSPAIMPKKN